MKFEISMVLRAHAEWLNSFHDILHGNKSFNLDEIKSSDQCILGDWLKNEGRRMIEPGLHQNICITHQEFHIIAAEVIQKIRDKRFDEARVDISPEGRFNQSSQHLRTLLGKLAYH